MFALEQHKCNQIAEEAIEQAKEQGGTSADVSAASVSDILKAFQTNNVIVNFRKILEFFEEHVLLDDATLKKNMFEQFVKSTKSMIEKAKNFKELSDQEQELYNLT